MHSQRVLFVINDAAFFLSHRLAIAIAAQKEGYDVHVATAAGDCVENIRQYGFTHHAVPLSRSGYSPFRELATILSLWRLMRHIKPDIVHLVTIKPVLYGGIVARVSMVPCVIVAISGLGTVFMAKTIKERILCWVVKLLYKLALRHKNLKVIFQNPDDKAVLVSIGAILPEQAVMIRGSGVSLDDYPVLPESEGIPVVTFASRLLKNKGVGEFLSAARLLKMRGIQVRFWLIGSLDPGNPSTMSKKELDSSEREGWVEILGYREDIPELFSQSHIIVLPSYYGEGLPKVLIEAAASGRAVVTTDHPGCRDAIEPDKTGLLVQIRDPIALADAIERLIKDNKLRLRMGIAGRKLAEREFSIERVVADHLDLYRDVLKARKCCD